MSRFLSALFAIALLLAAQCVLAAPVTVFAAASLKESLDEAARAYQRGTGTPVRVSYAASSALARQLAQGAPADVVLLADRDWMDHLAERGLLRGGTRRDLLGNALVLIAPRDARGARVSLAQPSTVVAALGDGRLALALTASVPAGRYARAALASLGLWAPLRPRVVEAENVRAALLLVARGEACMGVVYRTDALAEPRVRVLATFPARSHPPIVYPVAVVAASRHPRAEAFAQWLRTPSARVIFQRHGFVAPR
ncbi:MAG: molybdate ABC transporter substrate-binding protein [Pseudomonadota bacterium]